MTMEKKTTMNEDVSPMKQLGDFAAITILVFRSVLYNSLDKSTQHGHFLTSSEYPPRSLTARP